jgi:hypothetical protein
MYQNFHCNNLRKSVFGVEKSEVICSTSLKQDLQHRNLSNADNINNYLAYDGLVFQIDLLYSERFHNDSQPQKTSFA